MHFELITMKSLIFHLLLLLISMVIIAQPVNDDPCAAISIPIEQPDYLGQPCVPSTNYSWTGATLTTATPNPSCAAGGFSNIRDVWYKMVVPASGKIKVSIVSASQLLVVFYKQNTCSNTLNFNEVGCFSYVGVNTVQSNDLSSLTVGSTIYLRIMRSLGSVQVNGSAKICARETIATVAIDYNKRIGLGTNNPLANLDIAGKVIVRDSLSIGKTLEVRENLSVNKDFNINGNMVVGSDLEVKGEIKTGAMQVTTGAGTQKMMVSDAAGHGTWVTRDSIFSSPWVTSPYNSRDTVVDGTCLRLRHIDAPEITPYILNNKLITVYFRVGSIGPYQLPYVSDAGSATNQINCIFQQGKILLYRHTYNTCRFNSGIPQSYPGQPVLINLPQSLEYRYVIHN
jgi:hypothetical protein